MQTKHKRQKKEQGTRSAENQRIEETDKDKKKHRTTNKERQTAQTEST